MAVLISYKCKCCGESLDPSSAVNGVIRCNVCDSTFAISKNETSPKALDYIRTGEHELDTCHFDEAYEAFHKASEIQEDDSVAYWGMALATFGVQYIKDTVENRLQPICHTITEKRFVENRYYLKALQHATKEQKQEYENKAKEIEYIKEEFNRLKESGYDYDCFICVKVTDNNNEKTEDSKDAHYIYELLKGKGYKPFYSEVSIRNKTGEDYEARILYALYTSETMLIVCRDEEYLQTKWVKNEYTRFLRLVNDEEKESDSITFVYYDNPIEKLPGKKGRIQGIDFSRRDADVKIIDFVESHTPEARKKREAEKHQKEKETEELQKQIDLVKKMNSNFVSGSVSKVETIIRRAYQELEARNFDKAKNYYETALENAPENGYAWWGLFLCDFKVTNEEMIIDKLDISSLSKINNNHFLHSADKYSTDKLKDTITIFKTEVKNKIQQMTDLNDIEIAKLTDQMKSMQYEFDDKINSLNQNISENKKIIEEYKNVEYKAFEIPDKVFILSITLLTIGLIIAIPLIILTIIGHGNLSFDPLFQLWSKINNDLKMNWNDAGDIVMFIVMFLPATIFVIFIIILISISIYYIIFSPLIIIEQISIRKKNKNEKIMNEKIKKCEEEITKRYNQIQPLEDSKQHETDIINKEVMKLNSEKELMLRTIDFLK